MQKCSYCGADLPENTRFCGKCGSVQDAIDTDAAATRSTTPQPQYRVPEGGTIPATWPPYSNSPAQGSAPAGSPLYGVALGGDALLGSGQASTPGAPVVQGTPQLGSAPSVAGSPTPYTNAPVGPPAQGPGNAAPVSRPVQGPGSASISHPVQGPGNAPVSRPVQGPGNAPVSRPVQGPQPTHHPPGQPGTQEHHPPHGPHRHHAHPAQHEPHAAAHVTKVAGGSSVKTIILVVATVVVVAAGGIGAAAHFLSHQRPLLASSYQGTGHNITYNITSRFALVSVKEDQQGNISGNVIWTAPLLGTGPFTGKVNTDNSLVFTSIPTDESGFTITYTGTINADGSLSGKYNVNDGQQIGTWQVRPT